ncbi:hypothetical protein K7432_012655 [Basidiobolus ranarum]|uniref:Uncharacterized protein n=1 Tax=Basidiobolus ranarum TaxID=34480 RepID=A0ABR2WKG7_9FUNG
MMLAIWSCAATQQRCNPSARINCPQGFDCEPDSPGRPGGSGICVRNKTQRCNPSARINCPQGFDCKPDHPGLPGGSGICVRDN